MANPKTAILLLNLGTPENPSPKAVRKYLAEFLNDPRVITLPWLLRKILVNLIIVPFRAPRSSRLYQKLWDKNGSPLLFHGLSLQKKLQLRLGDGFIVALAMNYQSPNVKDVLKTLLNQSVDKIILFPLFPQYASSTTGSLYEKIFKIMAGEYKIPGLISISQYYQNQHYIEALAAQIQTYDVHNYDHVLFSYHGLPLSQAYRSHNGTSCDEIKCTTEINEQNLYCYHAACYATSRLLATKLNLTKNSYTVSFQSRIGRNWLSPFTDKVIGSMPNAGIKRLLVVCPSFTTDCLETIIEIGQEYTKLFIGSGGEELTLVESLNDSTHWVEAIVKIIGQNIIE